MNWLKIIARELLGLFVDDDGRFALAVLVWVGLLWWALPRLSLNVSWHAPLLLIGVLGILIESLWRASRKCFS